MKFGVTVHPEFIYIVSFDVYDTTGWYSALIAIVYIAIIVIAVSLEYTGYFEFVPHAFAYPA